MSRLPPGLRAWEPLLDGFDPDVAVSLGPWLARLSLAIGPLHANARPGAGDPDGYSGLSRRGPYDRLVLTEWAVAEVFPDEFTRRAAMGEHLFLDPRYQEPAGRRRSVVLFDVGPDQLGAPRLAHLAILVVMARRADRAGIPLSFGALQDGEADEEDGGLVTWTGPGRVTNLLSTRSGRAPTTTDVRAWLDRIQPVAGDDLWIVGGPAPIGPVARICVTEPVEPGDRTLAVEIRALARAPRRISLDLPAPADAVRLLRDPFLRATAAPRAVEAPGRGALRFTEDGRRLLSWSAKGAVVAWHVPNSPAASQEGRTRYFYPPEGHALVAAGLQGRNVLAVTIHADGPRGWPRERFPRPFVTEEPLPTAPVHGAIPPCIVANDGVDVLLFVDSDGDLWRWPYTAIRADAPTAATRIDRGVLALASHGHEALWIRRDPAGSYAIRQTSSGLPHGTTTATIDSGRGAGRAFFGYPPPISHPQLRLTGAARHDGTWRILFGVARDRDPLAALDLIPPAGTEVVGVITDPKSNEPALVVISADRLQLWVVHQGATLRVPTSSGPIQAACASTAAPHIAWRAADGGISVWSLEHRAFVLRLIPEEGRLTPADRAAAT